jgi:hypothetical protein
MSIAFYYFDKNNNKISLGEFSTHDLTLKEVHQLKLIMLEKSILDNILQIFYTYKNKEQKLDYYNLEDVGE